MDWGCIYSFRSLLRGSGYTKIVEYNNEEIKGSFYEPELQKATQELFRIEKVIRTKGDKSLIKWLGYIDSFNSWLDNDE